MSKREAVLSAMCANQDFLTFNLQTSGYSADGIAMQGQIERLKDAIALTCSKKVKWALNRLKGSSYQPRPASTPVNSPVEQPTVLPASDFSPTVVLTEFDRKVLKAWRIKFDE